MAMLRSLLSPLSPLSRTSFRARVGLIVGLGAAAALGMLLLPAIPQSKRYHAFVDQRSMLGVPNFLNVVSNVPFAVAGAMGLWLLLRKRAGGKPMDEGDRRAFMVLFTGSVLLSLGSAYYHLAPNNDRLVWDRLPMTIIFMSLFSIAISDRIDRRRGRALLVPLLALGAASVFYWRATDDLRFYGLVQFYPAAAIPLMMLLLPARGTGAKWLVAALGSYGVAKACEVLDTSIYSGAGGLISGHSLKHLFAAGSVYFLARMAAEREPLPEPAPELRIQGEAVP